MPSAPSTPPPQAPGASHGLAAAEVTASAAIAAGLAWTGPLAQESALRLYYLAAAAQALGRLTLSGEKGFYALTFKKGTPEHVHSSYPEDDLGAFLTKSGMLRPEHAAEAEAARGNFGGDLVGALIGLRIVNPADVFRALQEYGVALIWRALASDSQTGTWEPGVTPPASSFSLGAPWALFCDAVRRLDLSRVRLRLGARLGRSAVRVGGRIGVDQLRLTPQETRLYGLFDGKRSVEEIAAARPNEMEVILRLALLLGEAELLSFSAERQPHTSPTAAPAAVSPPEEPPVPAVQPPPPPVAPPAPGARPTPSPAAERDQAAGPKAHSAATTPRSSVPHPPAHAARPPAAAAPAATRTPDPPTVTAPDLAGLKEMASKLKEADHFQVLGVKREATASQIKMAYFQLAKIYHPDTGTPTDSPEVRKLRADIFSKIGEAWGVLGDEQKRTEYLEQLTSGGVGEVDASSIFEAEKLFEMAAVLVKTRQYPEAAKKLDEAIKLYPDEPEFGIWKAWVAFLMAPEDKRSGQQRGSANIIEEALRRNPRCMPGYLFLGQMAKLVGDHAGAEKHFKRGLVQDANHPELQRELKYLRKK